MGLDLDVLQRQEEELQAEARQVLADLDLFRVLAIAGNPVQLGSSVLGLMTWPDIDVHVYCQSLSANLSYVSLRPISSHPDVKRIAWANRQGRFQQPREPEGFYAGIRYEREAGCEWKIDVWFLPEEVCYTEQATQERIRRQLTLETRSAILAIKSIWADAPEYRRTVTSMDVYDAVLHHGVKTPEGFEAYLQRRGGAGS